MSILSLWGTTNMIYFIALLFFFLAYVIVKFIVSRVKSIAELAEPAGVVAGLLVALYTVGAIR